MWNIYSTLASYPCLVVRAWVPPRCFQHSYARENMEEPGEETISSFRESTARLARTLLRSLSHNQSMGVARNEAGTSQNAISQLVLALQQFFIDIMTPHSARE